MVVKRRWVFDDATGVQELPLEDTGGSGRVPQVPSTSPLAKFAHLCEANSLSWQGFDFDEGFDTPAGSESFMIMEQDTGGAGGGSGTNTDFHGR
jgi:hypothetical protein